MFTDYFPHLLPHNPCSKPHEPIPRTILQRVNSLLTHTAKPDNISLRKAYLHKHVYKHHACRDAPIRATNEELLFPYAANQKNRFYGSSINIFKSMHYSID